jgi:hypothetical protein
MNKSVKHWFLPSIEDVFFLSVFLFLALPGDKGNLLGDGDTGYHIRAGEYILNTLTIPKTDLFSFITPTLPWTAHEWLAEVALALLHQLGGLTAVVIFFALLLALSVTVFFRNIRMEGNNLLLTIIACSMMIALGTVHWLARPHIFSLFFLIIWSKLLDDFQYSRINRLWILPFIMLFWVNLHGGFIIGLAIMGIYFAGNVQLKFTDKARWGEEGKAKARTLGRILAVSTLVCLANPIGYKIFIFPFKLISNKYLMDHTTEFMSPNFHDLQPFKYLLFLLIVIFAFSKRKPDFIEILLVLLFTSMSLTSVRYVPLFAIIVIPILLRSIDDNCLSSFPKIECFLRQRVENITLIDSSAKGFVWPVASILLLVVLAANGTVTHAFNPEKKPIAALEFLRENPVAGNMFNNDEFGDLLIYTLSQQYKVFFDGRGDMYGSERMKEYFKITVFEPGWEDTLEKYKISWIFFDTNSVLTRFLHSNNGWKLIYSDKVASIFVRKIQLHQSLIEEFPNVELYKTTTTLN